MSSKNESRSVNIYINGKQADQTMKDVYASASKLRNELAKLTIGSQEWNDKLKELGEAKRNITAVQEEIKKVSGAMEENKGFFEDWKKGFSELNEIAERVTLGTLIYKGVNWAIEGIKELWNGAVTAYEEAVKSQTQLQQVLRSTGGVAGVTQKQLEEYQKTLMDQTGIDDDVIAKGEELLLTFTNIRGRIYKDALPAIIDMTAAMNGGRVTMEGVQQTAIQVGKALNDPINGFSALRRVGVSFTDQQMNLIKAMQKSGDIMGAQTIILRELQKEFGGTAKAIADTDVGQLQKFETDLGNLQERIGGVIISMKAAAAEAFDPFIKALADTEDKSQKLTDAFKKQSESVNGLQKDTIPLIDRYDELKSKGHLNNQEQAELKKVIGEIANVIPSAVTQWDNLGNAMGINTEKAREFVKVQQALLKYQNQEAIKATQEAKNDLIAQQRVIMSTLNRGEVSASGGGMASSVFRKLTDAELNDLRAQLKQIGDQITEKNDLLKGLTGSFMNDLDKNTKETTVKVKELSQMTVGELQDRLQSLNESLKETVIGSGQYKQVMQDITQVQQLLNQTKTDTHAKQKLEAYTKQLQDVREQADQLAESARKGSIDSLDAQVKVIEDKYQKVIAAINKLLNDPHTTAAIRKELNDRLNAVAADEKLAVAQTTEAFNKAQQEKEQKESDARLQAASKRIKDVYASAQSDLNAGENSALNGINSADPKVAEQERLNIQDEFAKKRYQLEQKSLLDQKILYQAYGRSTAEIDKKIADNTIKENQRSAKKKEADDIKYQQAKKTIDNMVLDNMQSGANLIESILDKRSALYKAALIADKAISIARVIMHTEESIAAFAAANAGIPIVGEALIASYTVQARIQEGIEIAAIAAAAVQALSGKGGSSSSARGYAYGGYTSVDYSQPQGYVSSPTLYKNSISGRPFVAGEGNKTEYVVSSAQLKNPVVADFVATLEAHRTVNRYEAGGYTHAGAQSSGAAAGSPVSNTADLSPVLSALGDIHKAIKDQQLSINYQYLMRELNKTLNIKYNANGSNRSSTN